MPSSKRRTACWIFSWSTTFGSRLSANNKNAPEGASVHGGYYKAANSESALGSKFLQTSGRQQAATSNEANQLTATHLHRANRFLLRLTRNHSLLIAVRFLKTLEEVLGLANNHARKHDQGNHVRNGHARVEDVGNGPHSGNGHIRTSKHAGDVCPAIRLHGLLRTVAEILEATLSIVVPTENSGETEQSQANHKHEAHGLAGNERQASLECSGGNSRSLKARNLVRARHHESQTSHGAHDNRVQEGARHGHETLTHGLFGLSSGSSNRSRTKTGLVRENATRDTLLHSNDNRTQSATSGGTQAKRALDNRDQRIGQGGDVHHDEHQREAHIDDNHDGNDLLSNARNALQTTNDNQTYRGVDINSDSVATSYNATLLQTLLRDTMGFEGFVNTDSNILFDIPWGVEELTPLERIALMYNAGSDIIGDWWGKPIDYSLALEAYSKGMIQEEALTRATTKNVVSLLESDRFENPYKDLQTSLAAEAAYAPKVETLALEMSTKSLVLLKNHNNVLPLKETGKKVFVASFTRNGEDDNKLANWNRTLTEAGYVIVEKAGEADIVLLDVKPDFPANNGCMNTLDLVEDLEVAEYDTKTGMKTGGMTDLTTLMDVKKIKKYAKAVHANGGVVICSLTLSAPWILTKLEPYCDAILVNFASVTELAGLSELVTITDLQLQVLSGAIMPTGKLPVTLPSCTAVLEVTDTEIDGVVYELCASPNDVPGYDKDQYIAPEVLAQSPSGSYAYQDEDGNTYKVWFGLTY